MYDSKSDVEQTLSGSSSTSEQESSLLCFFLFFLFLIFFLLSHALAMVLVLFHLVHEPFRALEVSPVDCDGCVDSKMILAVVRAVTKILRVIAMSGSYMYVFFRIMVRHLISPLEAHGGARACAARLHQPTPF